MVDDTKDSDDFENPDNESGAPEQGGKDSEEESSGAAGGDDKDEKAGEETLRKLQSERDKAVAERNKATKALKEMKGVTAKGEGTEVPAEVQEWIVAAKGRTRDALFSANPKFEAYGISPDLIGGESPDEMTASAKSLSEFVDTLEGKVRDNVLEEHGFDPEPRASTRAGNKAYNEMDKKEFDAIVAQALRG